MDDAPNRCRSECHGAHRKVRASLRPTQHAAQFDRPNAAFANNLQTQQLWPHPMNWSTRYARSWTTVSTTTRIAPASNSGSRQTDAGTKSGASTIGVCQTRWGNVTADNRRYRSLSTVTSTTSATRPTMELLRQE